MGSCFRVSTICMCSEPKTKASATPPLSSSTHSNYRENCTQKDICDVWNLAKQTVSTQCNELLDQGQINIVQNSENR